MYSLMSDYIDYKIVSYLPVFSQGCLGQNSPQASRVLFKGSSCKSLKEKLNNRTSFHLKLYVVGQVGGNVI